MSRPGTGLTSFGDAPPTPKEESGGFFSRLIAKVKNLTSSTPPPVPPRSTVSTPASQYSSGPVTPVRPSSTPITQPAQPKQSPASSPPVDRPPVRDVTPLVPSPVQPRVYTPQWNRRLSTTPRAFPPSSEVPGGPFLRVLPMMTVQPLLGPVPATVTAAPVAAPAAAQPTTTAAGATSAPAVAAAADSTPASAPSALMPAAAPATADTAASVQSTVTAVTLPNIAAVSAIGASNQSLRAVMHAYLRTLVADQLDHYKVSDKLKTVWTDTVVRIAERVAASVMLDPRDGDEMDIRSVLKIKRVPGGTPDDTQLVGGVVFTKNITHRKMRSSITNPRILLLSGSVEYDPMIRLSHMDTVLEQEPRYLHMATAKIVSTRPDIVLCQQGMARIAQDLLLSAGVTLVVFVKPSVMKRVARMTSAVICSAVDDCTQTKLGSCARVFTVRAPHGRTLLVLDGCAAAPGCTVVLRGAEASELAIMKRVLRFATSAAAAMHHEIALLAALHTRATAQMVAATDIMSGVCPPISYSPFVSFGPSPESQINAADHQYLVFLHAVVTAGGTPPCKEPALEMMHFYGEGDTPLGRFLEEACLHSGARCSNAKCRLPPAAHMRWYIHGTNRIAITVHPAGGSVAAADSELVVWSECQICDHVSAPIPLPDSAWCMSLGRFIECALLSTAVCASCGHALFAQHVLCFARHGLVARVSHEQVHLLAVIAPPVRLDRFVYPTRLKDKDLSRVTAAAEHAAQAFLAVLQEVAAQGVSPALQSALENLLLAIPRERTVFAERAEQLRGARMLDVARMKVDLYHAVSEWHAAIAKIAVEVRKTQDRARAVQQADSAQSTSQTAGAAQSQGTQQRSGASLLPMVPAARPGARRPTSAVAKRRRCLSAPGHIVMTHWQRAAQQAASAAAIRALVQTGPAAAAVTAAPPQPAAAAAAGPTAAEGLSRAASFGTMPTGTQPPPLQPSQSFIKPRTSTFMSPPPVNVNAAAMVSRGRFSATPPTVTLRKRAASSPAQVQRVVKSSVHTGRGGGGASLLAALAALFRHSNARTPMAVLAQLLGDTTPHALLPQSSDAVIVQEGEPSSLVAYSLASDQHTMHVAEVQNQILMESRTAVEKGGAAADESVLEKIMHAPKKSVFKHKYQSGITHFTCTAYYACQFTALRALCNCDERTFIESLSRCVPWKPTGGKSGSIFLKTADERFVLKAISSTELDSFLNVAPHYFSHVARSVVHAQPSLLVRLYGVYSITIKRGISGSIKLDVCVMENLFYGHTVDRIFDLKGSMRSRYVEAEERSAGRVLLDENLVEMTSMNPLLLSESAKQTLTLGVHRDSLFLARLNVMDYSLLVGHDTSSHRLVVGIVDYMRQYTWDKQMETWLKRSAGRGPDPTVISPENYKERFRSAMDRYFIMVPTKFTYWQPSAGAPLQPRNPYAFRQALADTDRDSITLAAAVVTPPHTLLQQQQQQSGVSTTAAAAGAAPSQSQSGGQAQ